MNPHSTLVWRRDSDGHYSLEGSATFRPRRVRISIDGKVGVHTYRRAEALRVVQDAIASGHARADEYALIPVETEETR